MEIVREQTGDVCRLQPQGELSIYCAAEFKSALLDAQASSAALEINLAEVSELDTAGTQLLMLAKREALAAGKSLALVEHSPAVIEVFELLNLAGWFGDPLVLPAEPARRAA
ncbi:MAG: STAS domain-containing protein [Zoogloea sp.]|nr:STAS domain-containing protein [Zoogloea sp.]